MTGWQLEDFDWDRPKVTEPKDDDRKAKRASRRRWLVLRRPRDRERGGEDER